MVGVFRRSLSFPNKALNRPSKPPISHHIRSISLPCRSHPLISQLRDEITELKTWSWNLGNRTSAWLCDGLGRLKDVHDSLHDLLQLPQTRELLSHKREWVEKILEDFLRFVDVYGIFQSSFLALKEEQLAARVALRRKDDSRIAVYLKSRRKMTKEIAKLVSMIRRVGTYSFSGSAFVSIADTELTGLIIDVVEVTVLVSVALFKGISTSFGSRKSSWMGMTLSKKAKKVIAEESIKEFQQIGEANMWGLRKKEDDELRMVLNRMQELERCIADVESSSDKTFRSLIKTRVSLLNSLTQ
ncbi:hypothetical protein F3Y22_tig00117056pilonHSYRG00835 [Hibiscus syriacus]|uniref:Uncharacterized protein n=1 Tax=Hibiscus syriacus TaxID=106335 RepID=A0A6A2X6Q4_HIBSY|nr:hypothetical protein F3Y22_tig00117056pilonHSYRG00835 [Hibiscus syriacus]